jgi:hypothetical protein
MAITGTLVRAELTISSGVVNLSAFVDLKDDQLGDLGGRRVEVNDPAVVLSVAQYVGTMLPTLTAAVGVPVSLPEPPKVTEAQQ